MGCASSNVFLVIILVFWYFRSLMSCSKGRSNICAGINNYYSKGGPGSGKGT